MADALPSSWRQTTLGEVAAPVPNAIVDGPFGSNLKLSDYVDEGVPVLQGKNITNDKFRWFDVRFISDRKARELKRSSVRAGDILIIKIGSIGYSAIVEDLNGFDFAIIPANLAKVTPDTTKVDLGYLHKWLTSVDAKRYLIGVASKTAQPALSLGKIKSLPLPLPPLAEQRWIAEVLARAEALRAKRRAALAQLDSLTQSLFLDLFGDPISNPRKWPQENLETFFHFRTGKLDSNAAVTSGQYPFFTCSREDFRIDTFAFDCEALLLAGNNASADYSVKHYKRKFNAYQRTYVITLRDKHNSYDYSRFVLEHRLTELKRISKGTNTKYLTLELLNRIRVPVPPIELQREFARRARVVEKLKTAQRASLGELDALFATLQHRAFRGEL